MNKPCKILDDKRAIIEISAPGEDGNFWTVGRNDVTAIVAYGEPGQGAYVPYFAIYKGDWLESRVNGADIEQVYYGDAPKDQP